jgi:hypothetical protein
VVYFSPNINQVIKSRMMVSWACSTYGKEGKEYKVLLRKNKGKRLLGRHRRRRENDINFDLPYLGQEGVAWINVA